MNTSRFFFAPLVLFPALAFAIGVDDLPWPVNQNLPSQVYEAFSIYPDTGKYILSAHVNPFYVHGDFDGDGQLDTAILIKEKSSLKIGIAILHSGSKTAFVLGAGNTLGNGGDDFSWMDAWHIYQKGQVSRGADETKPPVLKGDALYVEKTESASALLYWTGEAYAWYQQGD